MMFLAVLAGLWTAYIAKPILAPIAIAMLLKFLLAPWVRAWKARFGIPVAISAMFVVAVAIGGIVAAAATLAPAAVQWAGEMPDRLRKLEGRLEAITKPVATITAATEEVGRKVDDLTAGEGNVVKAEPAVVRLEAPGWMSTALTQVQKLLVELFATIVLLYLLLVSDGHVLGKLRMKGNEGTVEWSEALRDIERRISTYAWSMLLVHAGVGALTGLACWAFGLPNPVLWGALAAIGNTIPYVGPTAIAALLAVVGLTSFATIGLALLPAVAFLGIHALESNLVTPSLLGRWLSLSPVAIFIGVLVMGFIWGIAGLALAVPILVVIKICCEQVPRLQPIAVVLDGGPAPALLGEPAAGMYWLHP
jgi:predicted PurR-regulated permease PerM